MFAAALQRVVYWNTETELRTMGGPGREGRQWNTWM